MLAGLRIAHGPDIGFRQRISPSFAHRAGVEPNTTGRLQWIERGGRVSNGTLQALAAAFGIGADRLVRNRPASDAVRRITPIFVLEDIRALVATYRAAGFDVAATEDAGCVGLRAGATGVVAATADFMRGDYLYRTVEMMLGRATPHLHVSAVEAARQHFSEARMIEAVSVRTGTFEMVLERQAGLFILAEKRSEVASAM